MKFQLKVSHKVYLGFGLIVILLVISSLSSIVNLGHIAESTQQIKNIAVPVQKQSNRLQISLLKQAKLSTSSFNTPTVAQIEVNRAEFESNTENFNKDFATLAKLVNGDSEKKKILESAGQSYQVYVDSVTQMLTAIKNRIELNAVISDTHHTIMTAMDEAGASLMELSYLEDPKNQATLDQIGGAAGQLDGYLMNVVNTSKETVAANTIEEINKSKETVEFTVSNLDSQIGYLKTLATGIDTGGSLEQFLAEYDKGTKLLTGKDNLLDLKRRQLTLALDARKYLQASEKAVNEASNYLDELLDASDRHFNQLQEDNLENLNSGSSRALWMMLILGSLGLASAFLTTREMIRPLEGINNILAYMAQGDLTRKLDYPKQDEFGLLSNHINEVVEDLTELISGIVKNAALLTTAAENSSNEMHEMSAYVDQQKHKVSHVTNITQDMNESVDLVARQAQSAEQEMVQALEQSRQVDSIAKDNNARIAQLELQLEQTTSVIDRLQQESNNIGGIVETIRAIAEQTNLLALNAAIEAARAGEQGRGFAVVADEVRSLAGRTQQSTAEIQSMIENLQRQTDTAVTDISKGKAQASECVKYTDELTRSLSLINEAISKMHGMSFEIAEAARQQLQQSEQISNEVMDVVHIADKNAEKSASSLEYSSQVGQLADALNDSVNTFKV